MQTREANQELYEKALRQYAEDYHSKKTSIKPAIKKAVTPKYVIYARRSTKAEEKQTKSITSQIKHCKEFADREGIKWVEVLSEKETAMIPGKRKVFYEILENIKKGDKYNAIIAWHPDRLARNMKDSGEIMELLDDGVIVDLKFASYTFNNDASGKMMLNILFAMAKQFSDKLSVDTKRGIRTKAQQGLYGGKSKKGYKGKIDEPFRPDPKTFEKIQKAWKEAMQGLPYKLILDTTLQGLSFTENSLSYMFKDPFYAGYHSFGETLVRIQDVDPEFRPMISPQEFIMFQTERKKRLKSNWQAGLDNFYPFRGLVKCAYCGGFMTPGASKSGSKNRNRYLYVSCRNRNCPRLEMDLSPKTNTIRGKEILDYFIELLEKKLFISEELYEDFVKIELEEITEQEESFKVKIKEYKSLLGKKKRLRKEFEERLIDKPELMDRYEEISDEILDIKERLSLWEEKLIELQSDISIEKPQYADFVNFYENIVTAIKKTSDPELIDELVKLVCVNFVVDDKKIVSVSLQEPFNTYVKLESLSGVDDGT